jgi:hypothetical protein
MQKKGIPAVRGKVKREAQKCNNKFFGALRQGRGNYVLMALRESTIP